MQVSAAAVKDLCAQGTGLSARGPGPRRRLAWPLIGCDGGGRRGARGVKIVAGWPVGLSTHCGRSSGFTWRLGQARYSGSARTSRDSRRSGTRRVVPPSSRPLQARRCPRVLPRASSPPCRRGIGERTAQQHHRAVWPLGRPTLGSSVAALEEAVVVSPIPSWSRDGSVRWCRAVDCRLE